jgi:hypothetical protein
MTALASGRLGRWGPVGPLAATFPLQPDPLRADNSVLTPVSLTLVHDRDR